jgi:hypothetical protein
LVRGGKASTDDSPSEIRQRVLPGLDSTLALVR